LWQEYEAFASRDLSEFAVAYFFVDGVAEGLHAGMPREAVLRAGETVPKESQVTRRSRKSGGPEKWISSGRNRRRPLALIFSIDGRPSGLVHD
jgi:hypothetical protein